MDWLKNKFGTIDIIGSFIIGVVVLLMFQSLLGLFDTPESTIELAQSICDQEYNMDYDSYDNGVLKCKPKEAIAEVQYDGIVIQIGDER